MVPSDGMRADRQPGELELAAKIVGDEKLIQI